MKAINSITELLNNFIPDGVRGIEDSIREQQISHPVTIGSMYESLTREVISRSVFSGLNLRIITNSHIKGCEKEFDVILIEGEAKQLPYTDRYICEPAQVIAVVQVKKNLHSAGLADGYNNLKSLVDYYENRPLEPNTFRLLRDAFGTICGKDLSIVPIDSLTDQEYAIHQSLRIDAILPARIVWGFNGFKSERTFRESFFSYLQGNLTESTDNIKPYFGPHNFPDLVICRQFTLLKQNGMPCAAPLLDGKWQFYTSSSRDHTRYLLELLWTKLSYRFGISSDIFGDDLEVDRVNYFLDCSYGELNGLRGWHYNAFSPGQEYFDNPLVTTQWEPVELDREQFSIIYALLKKGEIDLLNDKNFEKYVTGNNYASVEEFLVKLVETRLVFIHDDKLRLLAERCECVPVNGVFYAADNKSGRLTAWAQKKMIEIADKNRL